MLLTFNGKKEGHESKRSGVVQASPNSRNRVSMCEKLPNEKYGTLSINNSQHILCSFIKFKYNLCFF